MRIAHLSDPHVLELRGVPLTRLLLNKRLTGWLNLKLHRAGVHRPGLVTAMIADVQSQRFDEVVVTGDVSNLSLESEFRRALEVFSGLDMDPAHVTFVPGNHDVYTRGAEKSQRFAEFFAAHLTSDVPVSTRHSSGPFPFVRLRNEVALIGLSSAVARPPMIASGSCGVDQLGSLEALLEAPALKGLLPVVLLHHPAVQPQRLVPRFTRGFAEGRRVQDALHRRRQSLLLHGHLHQRGWRKLTRGDSTIHHLGATSASLLHEDGARMAGYNVYEVSREGLISAEARVWNPGSERFESRALELLDPNWTR